MADLQDGSGAGPGIDAGEMASKRTGSSAGDADETPLKMPDENASEMLSEKPGMNDDKISSREPGPDMATGMAPGGAPLGGASGQFHNGAFARRVGQKEERKIKARKERGKGIWFGLGTMGMIGWSVAIPTLIGVAFGVWLDSRYPGQISWTLTFLSIGLAVGCANAWYWVRREQKGISGGDGRD